MLVVELGHVKVAVSVSVAVKYNFEVTMASWVVHDETDRVWPGARAGVTVAYTVVGIAIIVISVDVRAAALLMEYVMGNCSKPLVESEKSSLRDPSVGSTDCGIGQRRFPVAVGL